MPPHITLVYLRAPGVAARLIRWATWSEWSHVGVIAHDEPGYLIDASPSHGVARRATGELLWSASEYRVKSVPVPNADAGLAWARTQIGKPYDFMGVAGIGLHRDWQKPDKWFCSEFAEAVLAAAGRQRFINDAGRVTPQHSWMVA